MAQTPISGNAYTNTAWEGGGGLMEDICIDNRYDEQYKTMARVQDTIGWRRFMEGMVCTKMRQIQQSHSSVMGQNNDTERWGKELVIRLMEMMHGQWLYRNVQIHDKITGTLATQ
jgi:hypothetical protein